MRIGLNLLFMLPGPLAGIAAYPRNLIRVLATLNDENQFLLSLRKARVCIPRPAETIVRIGFSTLLPA